MPYLFTSESVSEGHPDKVADQISDALVDHFLAKFNGRLCKEVEGIAPEAMAALMAHRWPGNIRELENLMERSVLLADATLLGVKDLPGLGTPGLVDEDEEDLEELGLKDYVRVYTARLERARIQRALPLQSASSRHCPHDIGRRPPTLSISFILRFTADSSASKAARSRCSARSSTPGSLMYQLPDPCPNLPSHTPHALTRR